MPTSEYPRLVQRLVDEFWTRGIAATAVALLSPNFCNHDPNNPGVTSRQEFIYWAEYVHTSFPDFRVVVDELVAAGDCVTKRWTARGTQQMEFLGIPASGRPVQYSGMCIYHFHQGKITEIVWSYDMLGLLLQLGMAINMEAGVKER